MPELPEVETIRAELAARVLGRHIIATTLHRRTVLTIPGDPPGGFERARVRPQPRRATGLHLLRGCRIACIRRRGKELVLLAGGPEPAPCLRIRLGMSGEVLWLPPGAGSDQRDHIHATWRLDDGARFVFRDPRRFGGLSWHPDEASLRRDAWDRLGPDALSIDGPALGQALRGTRTPIKAALLDQRRLAGVGNIYADEALHRAGVHPLTPGGGLSTERVEVLATSIRETLASAIAARGSTVRTYRTPSGGGGGYASSHAVYGRGGEACRRCGGPLRSAVIAQRTTVWCEACQPAGHCFPQEAHIARTSGSRSRPRAPRVSSFLSSS